MTLGHAALGAIKRCAGCSGGRARWLRRGAGGKKAGSLEKTWGSHLVNVSPMVPGLFLNTRSCCRCASQHRSRCTSCARVGFVWPLNNLTQKSPLREPQHATTSFKFDAFEAIRFEVKLCTSLVASAASFSPSQQAASDFRRHGFSLRNSYYLHDFYYVYLDKYLFSFF